MPLKHSLALAISALLMSGAAPAATLVVDRDVDETLDNGACSLREAIENANSDSQNGRTSSGECAAGSGDDLILFDATAFAGTHTLALTGGQMLIDSSVTIEGTGRDRLIIDAGAVSRHFLIDDGDSLTASTVSLSSLTLRNGHVSGGAAGGAISARESLLLSHMTLSGNTVVNYAGGGGGGAVSVMDSGGPIPTRQVSFNDVVMTGNRAGQGGAFYISLAPADALHSVTLQNCLIDGNETRQDGAAIAAEAAGGRIKVSAGTLQVLDSTFSANLSEGNVGGLDISLEYGGSVLLQQVQIIDNQAGALGAARRYGGIKLLARNNDGIAPFDVQVLDSKISGNSASRVGGGLLEAQYAPGQIVLDRVTVSNNQATGGASPRIGGLDLQAYNSTVVLRNSTVSGNVTNGSTGGVTAYAYTNSSTGRLVIEDSTIVGNTANANASGSNAYGGGLVLSNSSTSDAEIVVRRSVIAGNTDLSASNAIPDLDTQGVTFELTDSLIGDNTGSGLIEAPLGNPDAGNNLIGSASGLGVIDAKLDPLGDYGGLTPTHLPRADSPLLDHYDGCPGTDQTGQPRGVDVDGVPGNDCDVGAVERQLRVFGDGFEASEGD